MTESSLDIDARRAADLAARSAYGRLVAMLAARTHDILAAEDALADAFASALVTWPQRGVPAQPEAWLLVAARRNLQHVARHRRVEVDAVDELLRRHDERTPNQELGFDRRLELLFVCAHPAIDESMRTPLMLQTVLGLEADRIAGAFLVAPSTMGQRLVRAKTKIKQARVGFHVPGPEELPDRLDDVLRAIYVAFGVAWDDLSEGRGLTDEALFLARLLVSLAPAEPEPKGLLALMLHCDARRAARRDAQGRFVPLVHQDASLWTRSGIIEAENLLTEASAAARPGRFQIEAAIQSVHAQRAVTGVLQHEALGVLYDLLVRLAPSIGALVARATALVEAGRLEDAARALAALQDTDVRDYQPYWVVRARLAEVEGRADEARASLQRALGLTTDPAVRRFLGEKLL